MAYTTWQFYTETFSAWQAMLLAIEEAKESVDLEQFVFMDDDIGRQFVETLKSKAESGVKVRLLVDYVGSFSFVNSGATQELVRAGAEIRYYNQIKPWRVNLYLSWFWRDHRKILLVDNKIFFTGGVGIEQIMHDWRDTSVRFEGEILPEVIYVFNRMWQMAGEGRFRRFRLDRRPEMSFRFLTNSPHFRQRYLYRRTRRAIVRAKKYIYLTTPYFIPNSRFLLSLVQASRRGVDVRLITPERSDHPFVDAARNSFYTILMKAGVRIYQYQNRVMHAKTAVVDDNWATVGSANLDNLSMLLNYEANVVTSDKFFIASLKDQFVNDILSSKELLPEAWHSRPWYVKLYELATWPFHSFM
jgi:cardiolipin synthase